MSNPTSKEHYGEIVAILKSMEREARLAPLPRGALGVMADTVGGLKVIWTNSTDPDEEPGWRFSVIDDGSVVGWGVEVAPVDLVPEAIARIIVLWPYMEKLTNEEARSMVESLIAMEEEAKPGDDSAEEHG
jgi:hypothetical protein